MGVERHARALGVVSVRFFLGLLVALAAIGPARAVTRVLEGRDEVRLRVAPGGPPIPAVDLAGYRQRLDGALLVISADLTPLVDRAAWSPRDIRPGVWGARRVAAMAAAAERRGRPWRQRHQVVDGVVSWLRDRLEYDLDRGEPDVESVLSQGRGNCVGLSNVATALLRAAGIPTLRVRGALLRPGPGAAVAVQLHRWIAVDLGRLGWVASDPTVSFGFVDALHVTLGIESDEHSLAPVGEETLPAWSRAPEELVEGLRGTLSSLDRRDRRRLADERPGPDKGLLARRLSRGQYASILRVRVTGADPRDLAGGVLVARLPDGSESRRRLTGTFLDGLALRQSGRVRVALLDAGGRVYVGDVILERAERRVVTLRPAAPTLHASPTP